MTSVASSSAGLAVVVFLRRNDDPGGHYVMAGGDLLTADQFLDELLSLDQLGPMLSPPLPPLSARDNGRVAIRHG